MDVMQGSVDEAANAEKTTTTPLTPQVPITPKPTAAAVGTIAEASRKRSYEDTGLGLNVNLIDICDDAIDSLKRLKLSQQDGIESDINKYILLKDVINYFIYPMSKKNILNFLEKGHSGKELCLRALARSDPGTTVSKCTCAVSKHRQQCIAIKRVSNEANAAAFVAKPVGWVKEA